jgi:uncharacterized membrane protein YjjB (DUF3815 family)
VADPKRSFLVLRFLVAFVVIAPLYLVLEAHRRPWYFVALIAAVGYGIAHLVEAAVRWRRGRRSGG